MKVIQVMVEKYQTEDGRILIQQNKLNTMNVLFLEHVKCALHVMVHNKFHLKTIAVIMLVHIVMVKGL
ncbi:UNVERIFIED_ORG: hypothetical protein [Escherichia phage CMSTMSU]